MFTKKKVPYLSNSEYAFSVEEIDSINKQNKQKIQELKQDIFTNKKEKRKLSKEEAISKIELDIDQEKKEEEKENNNESSNEILEASPPKEDLKQEKELIEELVEIPKNSFIKLSEEHQKLIMDNWNKININKIDKDIIEAKDLLNHNYTTYYADEATKFIRYIRKEYEIVLCYLIGFNNEKQGIFDKTIFSDEIDNEWKYLNKYIKILEKIRNFKKQNN